MSFGSKLAFHLGTAIGPHLIRVLGSTWRVKRNRQEYHLLRKSGSCTRVVYSFWHRDILLLGYLGRGSGIRVLISEHRDGELIARIVKRLGFTVFRGSTTRGGVRAMRSLDQIREDPSACDMAITPDGPRGPAKRLQKGVIFSASQTGFPIVPIGCAVERSWEMRSWDRFRIPKPFTRCWAQFGPEIVVPGGLGNGEMEQYRGEVEEAMHRAEEKALESLKQWNSGAQ